MALSEAVTAFVGGTLFLIGAYLSYVESLNPARHAQFGWETDEEGRRLVEPHKVEDASLGRGRSHFGRHHGPPKDTEASADEDRPHVNNDSVKDDDGKPAPPWRWVGTDFKSFGFVANFIQLYGATVFWVSVLSGLPGILPESGAAAADGLPSKSLGLWEGLFWAPQVLGAPGFIISGFMFMLEVQRRWFIPKLNSLGWHIGFWNLIGGIGFWLCGIFGVLREVGGSDPLLKWGSAFSTFWGSWAFLLGSYIQFYETLNKR